MKRDNRVWIAMAAVLALGAGLCNTTTAQPMQADEGDDGAGQRLSRMAEQIEIMRVVVTNAINDGAFAEQYHKDVERAQKAARKKLADELAAAEDADDAQKQREPMSSAVIEELATVYRSREIQSQFGVPLSFSFGEKRTFTSYTRGYYAAGVGVLFTTEVDAPVREMEPADESEQTATETDDEWARARAEALGNEVTPRGMIWEVRQSKRDARRWAIDERYVDLAVQGVIEAIAKHGLRLEGLAEDESIIMAMRFSADRLGFTMPTVVTPSGEDDGDSKAALRASELAVVNLVGSSGRSGRAADLNVVVEVPKSLLLEHDAGRMSMEELRRQATITSYSKAGRERVFGSRNEG